MGRVVPLTQGKFALVDGDDYELVTRFKWKYSNRGYAAMNYLEKGKYRTVLMHRLIMGEPKGYFVDHIDGNPLNNQKENLRISTNKQNSFNQGRGKLNKSGFKGVYWKKGNNKWAASIKTEGKSRHLGYFNTPEEAARIYNFWAADLFGEYARLNEINGKKYTVVAQG